MILVVYSWHWLVCVHLLCNSGHTHTHNQFLCDFCVSCILANNFYMQSTTFSGDMYRENCHFLPALVRSRERDRGQNERIVFWHNCWLRLARVYSGELWTYIVCNVHSPWWIYLYIHANMRPMAINQFRLSFVVVVVVAVAANVCSRELCASVSWVWLKFKRNWSIWFIWSNRYSTVKIVDAIIINRYINRSSSSGRRPFSAMFCKLSTSYIDVLKRWAWMSQRVRMNRFSAVHNVVSSS